MPATIGAVIVIIGLVPSFRPFPAWPDSLMVYILIAYIVLAAIGVAVWSKIRPGSTNQILATAIHAEDSAGAAPLVAHDWRADPDPPSPNDPDSKPFWTERVQRQCPKEKSSQAACASLAAQPLESGVAGAILFAAEAWFLPRPCLTVARSARKQ